jgi:hypothetical protein
MPGPETVAGPISPASAPDAGAFLARLLRLDPSAVVRLRPAPSGVVALWARLPFEVLVTRGVRAVLDRDLTVRADELLAAVERGGGWPAGLDVAWRWPLPPTSGRVVESVPAAEVSRLAAAAAATAHSAMRDGVRGRAIGRRMLRDALLDHVPILVADGAEQVPVSQRLVQAVHRMGFLTPDPVEVRRARGWVGLAAGFGAAWHRAGGGALPVRVRRAPGPNG